MNSVGKILVVLILVTSIFFMALALMVYATHTNWYDRVNNAQAGPGKPLGLKPQLAQERATVQNLQAQFDALTEEMKSERAAKDKRIANLETEKENLRRLYLENEKEHAGLVEDNRRLTGDMEATLHNATAQLEELNKLRETIRQVQLEKEKAFGEALKLTDDLHNADGQLKLLKDRNVQLTEQIAKAYAMLEAHDLNPNDPLDGTPPKVDGLVLAVNSEGLVEISIGADDGLRRGHVLEVFRRGASASKYLGRIEVVRTQPDRAVAKVLPEFRKGLIQKEDRVATRLN